MHEISLKNKFYRKLHEHVPHWGPTTSWQPSFMSVQSIQFVISTLQHTQAKCYLGHLRIQKRFSLSLACHSHSFTWQKFYHPKKSVVSKCPSKNVVFIYSGYPNNPSLCVVNIFIYFPRCHDFTVLIWTVIKTALT